MLTVISSTLFASVRLQTYIKADISTVLLLAACVCLRISLSAFLSLPSVRPDVIFLSGCGCYRLLTLGLERSSPSSTRPFNDGSLPAGGWMLPEDSCGVSLLSKPSQPQDLVSIWLLLRNKLHTIAALRRKGFAAAPLWNHWLVLCHFEGWELESNRRDGIIVCALYGFTCPWVRESWYKLLLWLV